MLGVGKDGISAQKRKAGVSSRTSDIVIYSVKYNIYYANVNRENISGAGSGFLIVCTMLKLTAACAIALRTVCVLSDTAECKRKPRSPGGEGRGGEGGDNKEVGL